MEWIEKINGYVKKVEEFILSYSVILMAIILVANVVGRTFFKVSLTFAEETSSILTVLLTFAGVSYCARMGRHINMTALFDAVPKGGKKTFVFISSIITAGALFYLAFLSSKYVMTVFNSGRYTSALQIPLWIPYIMLPLGFVFAGIQYLIIFVMNLRDKEIVYTSIEKEESAFDVAISLSKPAEKEDGAI